MSSEQFVHHPDADARREADFLSSSTSPSENSASAEDFAAHLAVRIATINAVAMMMDGPSFGQSGRRSFPTIFTSQA
jgi:hypothetical protein